MEQHKV